MQPMQAVLVLESKTKMIAQSELWRLVQASHTSTPTKSEGKQDAKMEKVFTLKNFSPMPK